MKEMEKEFIVGKLTELYIKETFEEKKTKQPNYIRKADCYKDLIKFFKEQF